MEPGSLRGQPQLRVGDRSIEASAAESVALMGWQEVAATDRIWDVMDNWVLVALPMFITMGLLLDRSGVASELMTNFSRLFGRVRGGLAVTVAAIGILLAGALGARWVLFPLYRYVRYLVTSRELVHHRERALCTSLLAVFFL